MNKYVILWDVVFVSLFLLYLFYVNEISLTSGLMDRDEWKNLGLPEDEVKRNTQSEENIKGSDISKSEGSK